MANAAASFGEINREGIPAMQDVVRLAAGRCDRFWPYGRWIGAPISLGLMVLSAGAANALPSFAEQTHLQCSSCHAGGFGPQLTDLGRDFKMRGYTLGDGKENPVSAMAIASLLHTSQDQNPPPAEHASSNDNLALDQASAFLAGGIGQNLGGFIQATYDGVERRFLWDNVDLRAVNSVSLGGKNLLMGLSFNNSPGVQDPWNTMSAWGYPYTDSALAPSPAASPISAGGLAQTVVGASGYLWWDRRLYVEAGLYGSPGTSFLKTMGLHEDEASGMRGTAPYGRLAYQLQPASGQTLEFGAFGLFAEIYPERDKSAGTADRFHDIGADASYQMMLPGGDIFSINGRYTREDITNRASFALGNAANTKDSLNDLRADVSYFSSNGFGATLGAFNTTGKSDALMYAESPSGSPDSGGVQFQFDYTPWGNGNSPLGGRTNARIGAQVTHYSKFDGASKNYDGLGANASDNDSLRLFFWLAG